MHRVSHNKCVLFWKYLYKILFLFVFVSKHSRFSLDFRQCRILPKNLFFPKKTDIISFRIEKRRIGFFSFYFWCVEIKLSISTTNRGPSCSNNLIYQWWNMHLFNFIIEFFLFFSKEPWFICTIFSITNTQLLSQKNVW